MMRNKFRGTKGTKDESKEQQGRKGWQAIAMTICGPS